MNILDKNNYKYPEEEKRLLDELKQTFFSKCSDEYKRTYDNENNTNLTL